MPTDHGGCAMILNPRPIARALDGDLRGRSISAPGPGHSRTDQSLMPADPKNIAEILKNFDSLPDDARRAFMGERRGSQRLGTDC